MIRQLMLYLEDGSKVKGRLKIMTIGKVEPRISLLTFGHAETV